MKDSEIIKALECCDFADIKACEECPLYHTFDCSFVIIDKSLDLINRQNAEIERYLHSIKLLENDVATAKSEAIKEFSRKLKKECHLTDKYGKIVMLSMINKIGREMVKGQENE